MLLLCVCVCVYVCMNLWVLCMRVCVHVYFFSLYLKKQENKFSLLKKFKNECEDERQAICRFLGCVLILCHCETSKNNFTGSTRQVWIMEKTTMSVDESGHIQTHFCDKAIVNNMFVSGNRFYKKILNRPAWFYFFYEIVKFFHHYKCNLFVAFLYIEVVKLFNNTVLFIRLSFLSFFFMFTYAVNPINTGLLKGWLYRGRNPPIIISERMVFRT